MLRIKFHAGKTYDSLAEPASPAPKIQLGVIGVHNLNLPRSIPFCFISIGNEWDWIVPEIDLAKHQTFTQIIFKSANI